MTDSDHLDPADPNNDVGEDACDDDDIDWSNVDEVAQQIADIDGIEDEDERVEAARQWAKDLNS